MGRIEVPNYILDICLGLREAGFLGVAVGGAVIEMSSNGKEPGQTGLFAVSRL